MATEIRLVRDLSGRLHLEHGGTPPTVTVWSAALVEALRHGHCGWASIDGDLVEVRTADLTLWYRLTGETDLGEGLISERVTADGTVWGEG